MSGLESALGIAPDAPAMAAPPVDDIPTMKITAPKGAAKSPDLAAMLGIPDDAPVLPARPPAPRGGMGRNIGAGMVEGGAGLLNALSDPFGNLIGKPLATAATFAHDALAPVFGYERFPPDVRQRLLEDTVPQPGTRLADAVGTAMGAPLPSEIPADTGGQALARGVAAGAIGGAGLSPASISPAVGALAGAGGAVGGQSAASMAPEWAAPAAELAGNVAGGAAAIGGAAAVRAGARRSVTDPLGRLGVGAKKEVPTAEGGMISGTDQQFDAAAQQLRAAAERSGPDGVQRFTDALNNNPRDIVPGSNPTTAQVAPLSGIAQLEDAVRTRDGAPFIARDEAQNNARIASIQGIKPQDWKPGAVGQTFRQMHDAIEAEANRAASAARGKVGGAIEGLGEAQPPDTTGQAVRGVVEGARTARKVPISRLYDAIDPDGTLALPVESGRQAAQAVMKDITPELRRFMPGDAMTAIDLVANMPDVVPFKAVRQYMETIGNLQREIGASMGWESQPVRRLGIVKNALADDIQLAADRVAESEAAAVSAGTGPADGGIVDRFNKLAVENAGTVFGGTDRAGAGAAPGLESPVGAQQGGAEGQGNRGPGVAASDSGVEARPATGVAPDALLEQRLRGQVDQWRADKQPAPEIVPAPKSLEPNFPPEAAAQIQEANRQYRDYKADFRQGPIGDILKSGRGGAEFSMRDSAVGPKIVAPEALREYLRVTGATPDAMAAVQGALMSDLRARGGILPDGTVNPQKLAAWQQKMRHSLDQVPDIAARVRTVAEAQRLLDETMAQHQAQLREFQNGVARRFLNEEPDVAVTRILRGQDRIRDMRKILADTKDNPDARASLQGHVVDYIIDRLTSSPKASEAHAAGAGATDIGNIRLDTFKDWVQANKPWLRDLFEGGQGMQRLEMVAADLRRRQVRGLATKGSPTAERGLSAGLGEYRGAVPTAMAIVMGKIAETGAGLVGINGLGGLAAEATGAGLSILMHALRQKGITTVNALVREAMLNPEFAKALMTRTKDGTIGPVLQRRIAAALLASMQQRDSKDSTQ